jgi:hypothetical protein
VDFHHRAGYQYEIKTVAGRIDADGLIGANLNITYVVSTAVDDQYAVQWRCGQRCRCLDRQWAHQASLLSLDEFVRNTPEAQRNAGPPISSSSTAISLRPFSHGYTWKRMGKKVVLDLGLH